MAINILDIQPSVVSRDLRGKYIMVYGIPKCGKTSFAAQFPKNLICGFEHGWNALGGVLATDVTTWAEFKTIIKQLERPEAQEKFNTITIDTIAIAWQKCEDYICAQNGVQKISEIAWGQGYSLCKKEFENCLRKITQLGYGLIIIAHSETRKEKGEDDTEIEYLAPSIPKRCYEIVNQIVDIIGYIAIQWDENGNSSRYLYTRKTPTIMAGSRFKYLKPVIKFGYQELVDAISEAIDAQEEKDGITVVDTMKQQVKEKLDFQKVRAEAEELWKKLVEKNPDNVKVILKKIEIIFGHQMKLSEVTEDQVELMQLVVDEMREMSAAL